MTEIAGDIAADFAGDALKAFLSSLLNRGNAKASKEVLEQQLKIATMLANLTKQQADIDLPFRQGVLGPGGALQQRSQQQFPAILPDRNRPAFDIQRNSVSAPKEAFRQRPTRSIPTGSPAGHRTTTNLSPLALALLSRRGG